MNFQSKACKIILLLLLITYSFFLTRNSVSLNDQFLQFGDFAAYDQVIHNLTTKLSFDSSVCSSVMNYWNTVGAKSLDKVPPVNPSYSVLGIHFVPMLLITNALPNFIYNSPNTTFFIHSIAFVLTALFLFLIFLKKNLDPKIALALCYLFLIHPSNLGANINAFHPVVLAVPLLTAMYYCLLTHKMKTFWILFIFTGFIQENLSISLGGLSLWFLFKKDFRKFGFTVFAALVFLILTTRILIPLFNPENACPYCSIYGSPLGSSMGSIIKNSFLKPHILFQQLTRPEVLEWFVKMNISTLFLIIASPMHLLMALSGVVPNLLSNNKSMLIMWGQYSVLATPFIFIGVGQIISKFKNRYQLFNILFLALMTFGTYISVKNSFSPYTDPRNIFSIEQKIYQEQKILDTYNHVLSLIPQEASVSSTETVLNKLHRRSEAYIFPVGHLHSDYLIVQKTNLTVGYDIMLPRIEEVIKSNLYQIIFENEFITVYKKN